MFQTFHGVLFVRLVERGLVSFGEQLSSLLVAVKVEARYFFDIWETFGRFVDWLKSRLVQALESVDLFSLILMIESPHLVAIDTQLRLHVVLLHVKVRRSLIFNHVVVFQL